MENVSTSSESQLKSTGLLQDLTNHKRTKVTDLSLINSTLKACKPVNAKDCSVSTGVDKSQIQAPNIQYSDKSISPDNIANSSRCHQTPILNDAPGVISCKEEKQRQNEEIVILESSSLSSETGSWESVFPSKYSTEKGMKKNVFEGQECLNEIDNSKDLPLDETPGISTGEDLCPSLVQKSPFKSTSCFIDAASLIDEGDDTVQSNTDDCVCPHTLMIGDIPEARKPVPPSTEKSDVSPNDWSESNENEDSLEQPDDKDQNFDTNDLSPTMFEMTPLTEDSLSTNAFENAAHLNKDATSCDYTSNLSCASGKSALACALIISETPNNSMVSDLNHYDSENSELNSHLVKRDNCPNIKKNVTKYHEFSPIVSGGASIEDHLPQSSYSGSPMTRRKNENMPIISGAYVPKINTEVIKKHHKPITESMWVVDMSTDTSLGADTSSRNSSSPCMKKTENSDNLKNFSKLSLDSCYETFTKSRSSVDSDCSEKSSQKFYIDLSNIPDPVPVEMNSDCKSLNEKKNMFSMYIDLGEQSSLKEMPARLLSSKHTRKSAIDSKPTSKSLKSISKNFTLSNTSPFEKYESLCNDPNISIRDIIRISDSDVSPKSHAVKKENMLTILTKNKSKANTVVVSNNVTKSRNNPTDAFVKLSDLDKPQKVDTSLVIHEEKVLDVRMTRSIPENKWNQSNTMPSRAIISSFHSENTLSLNRLFPHLKNEFSRSSPGLISNRTKSPMRAGITSSPGDDDQHSEVSEISSAHSSVCHSIVEHSTTEETSQASSLLVNCQSRLGQDLLRMFLEEIAPDVIVEVSGRRIKAHKCILSSRCQYFAGILSGGWVESAGNVIVLPPFSFSVVHFALCHIYSGVSTIPDSISIVELATIADMLGLEGLKEAIMFTLKAKYCHHFHQPCPVCIAGVLECFPLSSVYGLDDLYRKCLKWITKYFSKVWPTKAFATLPKELLDKCYQQHIVNMNAANLLDTIYGCGITVASLQNSRWAESVARMCHRLVNAAAQYAAPRLVTVLHALNKLPPQTPAHAKQALEDCISVAIEWAPPDEACRAYAFLSFLIKDMRNNQRSKPDLISSSNQSKGPGNNVLYTDAVSWLMQCESALVRAAPRVVGTQAFKDLPSDLKKKLRELGCIMYRGQNAAVSPSFQLERNSRSTIVTKSNKNMKNQCTSRSLDIDHVRASFVPYAPKPKLIAAPVDTGTNPKIRSHTRERTIKDSNSPKIRTTKAQEERARFNLSKSIQLQENSSNKKNSVRPSSDMGKIEPRTLKNGKKIGTDKKLIPKMISSSESSRNSSPIQSKNLRTSGITSRQNIKVRTSTAPQDILVTPSRPRTAEPSSESLNQLQSNPKYATYVKTKHSIKGSIESVSSSKNFNAPVGKKIKTKIPIYLNHGIKSLNNVSKKEEESENRNINRTAVPQTNNLQIRSRNVERKVPGSLMNATKSSSAKMVLKRDVLSNKSSVKISTKPASHANETIDPVKIPEIPVMERSDTFLKDEPTFGDKITNLDIDQ